MFENFIKTIDFTNYSFGLAVIIILTAIFYFTSKIKWFAAIPLFIFVIWAFFKRVLYLGVKCFWWDEFFTEQRVWLSSSQIFKEPMTARCLLYSFILKIYASIITFFNNQKYLTEFQLRLPHAIIGTFSLFIIYLIGKRIKDKATGLLMVFFAAFSSFLIYYAREARFYPFVLFFSACIIHSVVLIIYREKDCQRSKILLYYVYYTLTAICGMHTHQGFWLLFAASNIFLGVFELTNFIFNSKDKRKDFLFLISVILLLVLPVLTAYSGITSLLGKGAESNIIKSKKLVPRLDIHFFRTVHNELWEGFRFCHNTHFIVLVASFVMLLFKKTRKLSLYIITVIALTFIALRNMGTFREPFRVKYITFMWLTEMICIISAFAHLFDYLFSKVKNRNVASCFYCLLLSLTATIFLINPISIINLPKKNIATDSYRTMAQILNQNIKPNDIILSTEAGYEALKYYKRVYSSNWKILDVNQIESKYNGNYIYDGFVYCLFEKTPKMVNDFVFEKLTSDKAFSALYKSKKTLNKSLQNSLIFALKDGFKDYDKLKIRNHVDRLFFTDNYIVNGIFTNGFNGWRISNLNKNISICVLTNNYGYYLNITNNFVKSLILSQTVFIPTGGLYSLTFKTQGFHNGGHFSIESKDINIDIYRDEIKKCLFTRFHNFKFKQPQKVNIKINIKPKGYAAIYEFGFYRLDKEIHNNTADLIKNDSELFESNNKIITLKEDKQEMDGPKNLLINGDFNDGLKGWSATKGVTVSINDFGNNCAEFSGQVNSQTRIWQTFNAVSGHVYRLTFKAKSEKKHAFAIFRDDKTNIEEYLYTNQGKSWKKYFKDFTAKRNGDYRLFLSCQGEGKFYYTDASLIDISE